MKKKYIHLISRLLYKNRRAINRFGQMTSDHIEVDIVVGGGRLWGWLLPPPEAIPVSPDNVVFSTVFTLLAVELWLALFVRLPWLNSLILELLVKGSGLLHIIGFGLYGNGYTPCTVEWIGLNNTGRIVFEQVTGCC